MRRSRFVGVLVVSVMLVLAFAAVPALAAEPPTIDGESSGGVTATAASLTALINPNGQETTYTFEYSTEATGETLEGTVEEASGAGPLPEVAEDQSAEVRVEPLSPHTLYYYRVVATNASKETTTGVVQSFTTALPPEKPTVEAELEGLNAKLKGVLNPNNAGEEGSYEFLYKLSATECEGEGATATETTQAFGAKEESVAAEVVGLEPNATYAFCLLANNLASETAASSVTTLTTAPEPPAISEETTSGLTPTGVTLLGQINPNNQETTYAFEYATNEALESATSVPGASPLSGFGNQAVETKLEGLQPRTKYFWRIAATNATGEAPNGNVEFTTLDKPLVEVEAAQAVTRTTAAVAGKVNPGGLTTRAHLVYVEEGHYNSGALECPQEVACAYGEGAKTTPNEQIGGADYSVHAVGPLLLGELKPGKIYHYALVATNAEGTRITSDKTFTTSPATPPSASTGEASSVTQLSATLSGTADTRGLPGTLSFQVALSPEGGSLEPASVVSGSQSGTSVSITFSFGPYLQPGTTYYYRAFATNADGTAEGEWRSFTTGTFPSPFAAGPPSIPLLHIPAEEKPAGGGGGKPLTNAQKLSKALKACHKDKKKSKRAKCERTARHRYAPKHKK